MAYSLRWSTQKLRVSFQFFTEDALQKKKTERVFSCKIGLVFESCQFSFIRSFGQEKSWTSPLQLWLFSLGGKQRKREGAAHSEKWVYSWSCVWEGPKNNVFENICFRIHRQRRCHKIFSPESYCNYSFYMLIKKKKLLQLLWDMTSAQFCLSIITTLVWSKGCQNSICQGIKTGPGLCLNIFNIFSIEKFL